MIDTTNNWAIRTQTSSESEAVQRMAINFGYTEGGLTAEVKDVGKAYVMFNPETKQIIPIDDPEPYVCLIVNRIEDALNLLKNIPGNVGYVDVGYIIFASGDVIGSGFPYAIPSETFDQLIAKRNEVLSS